MRYEGSIYRPPSEANSLLIQATIGCPHNRCTFCMIYKNRPGFRVRPVAEIKADILSARQAYGSAAFYRHAISALQDAHRWICGLGVAL